VKGIKGKAIFILKVAVSVILVCLVIARTGLGGIADSLRTIGPDLGLALACALLFTFLKVLKWHYLVLAAAGEGTTLGSAAKSFFVGMAGGLLTPGRVGEIARTVFMEKHSRGLIAYLVVVDRIFEITAVVFLALPGLLFYANFLAGAAAVLLLVVLLMVIYFPEYPPRWLHRILDRTGKFAAAREQLGRMELKIAAISPGVKFKQLLLAVLSYAVVILQFHHLLNNVHHSRLWMSVLAQPLIMLTNILPFTIGGLGIREGAAMVLLSPFAIPAAAAISAAFLLFLLNTALPALIGALVLLPNNVNKRKHSQP